MRQVSQELLSHVVRAEVQLRHFVIGPIVLTLLILIQVHCANDQLHVLHRQVSDVHRVLKLAPT